MKQLLKLTTVPVIKEFIEQTGQEVEERISGLNINNIVATSESVKSLKNLRAELRSELKQFEEQRKNIKLALLAPYDQINPVYEEHVKLKYNKAVELLTTKVSSVENEILKEKKTQLGVFFSELIYSEGIDFITFERYIQITGTKIQLSITARKLRENVSNYIESIVKSLELISSEEHEAEILTEFKNSLNIQDAILKVRSRKAAEEKEKIRIFNLKCNSRWQALLSLGFNHKGGDDKIIEMTVGDEDIIYEFDSIGNVSDQQFQDELDHIGKNNLIQKSTTKPAVAPRPIEMRQPVEVAPAPEKKVARFVVHGTIEQLRSLKSFMEANEITFKTEK